MDEAWRERVRERAYAIWLREGSPDGRAEQFWLMAEEELLAEGQGQSGRHPDRPTDEGVQADQASDDGRRRAMKNPTRRGRVCDQTGKHSLRSQASRPC